MPYVSIVVPVYNSAHTIDRCLSSIMALQYPSEKLEVIVVDDGSSDETMDIVRRHPTVITVQKGHGGYPSAMNAGIKMAQGNIIVIVDSDIYLTKDWLAKVLSEFNDSDVGIVSGFISTASTKSFWARLAGYDVEDRLDKLKTKYVDHIGSTCTAYRKELFKSVGFFDEKLKRNSDEDLAHSAFKDGWKLVLRKDAVCFHEWRASLRSYFKQQLGQGKYAVNIIRKAPELLFGKKVQSPSLYIPVIFTFLLLLTPVYFLVNYVWVSFFFSAILVIYHIPSAVRIITKHQDWTMLLLPIAINVRYVAWLVGLVIGIISQVVHQ